MHAFFKALLFLAAGSVIHAVHSNELADMGGLMKKMRLTGTAFVVGTCALAGIPGLAGFFSKDLILEVVAEHGMWGQFAMLMAAAFLTAFYMGRVIFLAFFGEPTPYAQKAHEHGLSMGAPLVLLSFASLFGGLLGGGLATLYGVPYTFHFSGIGAAASGLAIAGFGLAWLIYQKQALSTESFAFLSPLGRLARSAALDRGYEAVYRRGMLVFAAAIGWLDRYVVDGVMNLSAWVTIKLGERLRRMQTGNAQDYVYAVVAGAVVLAAWGILR